MPAALTLWAASSVPVSQDTMEMDLLAQVNQRGIVLLSYFSE